MKKSTYASMRPSRDTRWLATIIMLILGFASMKLQAVPGELPDTGGGSIGCGSDGICNIGQCSNDPDCPGGVGSEGGGGNTDPRPSSAVDTIDCTVGQTDDINAAASALANDWNNFERSVEAATGRNIGNCLQNRFQQNGKVLCVADYNCKNVNGVNKCKLGFGPGLKKRIKIFQTFFDNVAGLSDSKRRGCYAALMVHEFSHTCEHYAEGGPEARAVATGDYWNTTYGSSVQTDNDCGMND